MLVSPGVLALPLTFVFTVNLTQQIWIQSCAGLNLEHHFNWDRYWLCLLHSTYDIQHMRISNKVIDVDQFDCDWECAEIRVCISPGYFKTNVYSHNLLSSYN